MRLRFSPQLESLETREVLSPALGMNLEPVADYMGAWMFTDAFKQSRPWQRTTNGSPDFSIALDARGNPAQLTTGQQVQTVMLSRGIEPPGTYTAWWQGDGRVTWGGDVDQTSIQLGTTPDGLFHTALLTVSQPNQGISMTVQPNSGVDVSPIHDAHVWMPDYNGQHFAGQIWQPGASFSPFHPLFLQRLQPFHTLRFKTIQETDNSSLQHWSSRRDVNYETQQSAPNLASGSDDGLVRGPSAAGNTATTLTDATANWATNQWAGFTVQITSGTGINQVRTIASNTNNQLTISSPWTVGQIPDNTSRYAILEAGPQTGRSSGGNTTTTLNDSTQTWTTNQWAGFALRITDGQGANQTRAIVSNTGTLLTLSTPWLTTPNETSTYAIEWIPGIAPEYIVELSNELRADAWINIPHMAQDDYISGLAALVHSTLNPNQHVYLEWSNEAFLGNSNVDPNQWLRSLPGGNVPSLAAGLATHAFGIWSQVFADRPGQLIRVAAGFNGGSFYNDPFLAAMDQQGHNFDAFAVAPYFGNLDVVAGYTASTTVDQILNDVTASIAPTLNDLRAAKALADQYHVRFFAYEGGPSVQSPPGTPQAVETLLSQAARDPRNYAIFSNILNQLGPIGLELFTNFEYTDTPSFGIWGALDHQDQALADAHKYRALLDYLATNGLQFSAATYSVPKNGGAATVTVTRGSGDGTVSINYATSNGTALAGAGYTATSGTLTFGPGETSKTFNIPILNDNLVTGNQTVNLTLSNPMGGGLLGSQNTAVLTIIDSNLPQVPNSPRPANLGQVATFFAHSWEHYTQFVTNAYLQYLGRAPDAAGLAAWVSAMATQRLTDERLEAGFIGSPEYVSNHGGPGRGWIVGLYRDLLGRTPAESEINGWLTVLANGATQFAVAYGFAASAEREGIRVRTNYLTYLGRDASATEINGWVQAFLAGAGQEDLVAVFVGSPEYYANPQKGNGNRAVWVSLAYRQVLFRAPTISEVNGWVAVLN